MRPNLMSPRRTSTSGEDSILAMLEREPTRKRGGGATGARMAWYGGGAGLVVALTGALVWLAAHNDGIGDEVPETVLAEAVTAAHPVLPGETGLPAASAPSAPAAGPVLHQVAMAPAPGAAAVIVDQPPAEPVPPLRLLKPAPGAPAEDKAEAPVRVSPPPAAPAAPSRIPPAARTVAVPRPQAAPADARPAARPSAAKPKPVLVAKAAPRTVQPKAQRGAAPAKTSEGPVDADVALISAVIVHANGHAPEGSQMTELLCPNNACQAKPARQ